MWFVCTLWAILLYQSSHWAEAVRVAVSGVVVSAVRAVVSAVKVVVSAVKVVVLVAVSEVEDLEVVVKEEDYFKGMQLLYATTGNQAKKYVQESLSQSNRSSVSELARIALDQKPQKTPIENN